VVISITYWNILSCHILKGKTLVPIFNTKSNIHPNVWLLMFAQALIGSIGPVIVFVGGFIGLKLAPTKVLATLPIALMVVGIAIFMLPVIKALSIVGRKKGFIIAIVSGSINCLFAAYTIEAGNFWLFCLSILLFGIMIAAVQQFRFAAMESVPDELAGKAVSILLVAGLIAAFIGPEVAFVGKDWFETEFVGSFIGVSVLLMLSVIFIAFYKPLSKPKDEIQAPKRELKEIIKQPVFLASIISATVGFSVMSFIMTATPISMHVHSGFDMQDTKWVIQSHIIAMYLPSFFTGRLIQRFGQANILYSGMVALFACIIIGFAGHQYVHYWGALVLLGIGWNFMFITATSLLPRSYTPSEKFKIQGLNDLVMFTCQAVASLSAGWVINTLGWNAMLVICIPLLLVAAVVVTNWRASELKINSAFLNTKSQPNTLEE
jgi:MFS family permease